MKIYYQYLTKRADRCAMFSFGFGQVSALRIHNGDDYFSIPQHEYLDQVTICILPRKDRLQRNMSPVN